MGTTRKNRLKKRTKKNLNLAIKLILAISALITATAKLIEVLT